MLLVGNGRLITRDEAFPYAEDGAVALDGEVIKEVGALSELRAKYPNAEFVDARGSKRTAGGGQSHHLRTVFGSRPVSR